MTVRPLLPAVAIGLLGVSLVVTVLGALAVGATGRAALHVFDAGAEGDMARLVITRIRAPRIVFALFGGAALAASGAVMQGLFRNPLADPGLIGVSSGAALGATLAIVSGLGGWLAGWAVPLGGLVGGLVSTALLYGFSTRGGVLSTTTVILAGVALGAFSGALTGILIFRADDAALRDLTFWTMGSLAGATWTRIGLLAPFFGAACLLIGGLARSLNALLLGETDAELMGYRVERAKRLAMLGVALATGPVVAFAGVIGFVGVVVPHLVRLVTGPDHRVVLPCSALLGAILLIGADTLARVIAMPAEVPVGIVTAAIGAPVFVWLLARTGRMDAPS